MSFIKTLLNSLAEKICSVLQNKHSTHIPASPPALQNKATQAAKENLAKPVAQNTQKMPSTPSNEIKTAKHTTQTYVPEQDTNTLIQAISTSIQQPHKKVALTIRRKLTIQQSPAAQKIRCQHIERLARQNDPEAQCKLGLMYFNGTGIEQNDDMAKYWLENASHQELAMGQFNLAGMYYHGRGGEQNYETARDLFEKAAKQGLAEAQFHLSGMYAQGKGIEHDAGKAHYWLEEAARQNHREAQIKLLNTHCYHV